MRSKLKIVQPILCVLALVGTPASGAILVSYGFNAGTLAPSSPDSNVVVSNVTLPGDFDVSNSTNMVFFRSNAASSTLAGAIAGGIDTASADYVQFSIRAASGQFLNLESLTFDHLISNDTSPFTSNFAVFASLDNFATAPTAGTELGTSTATASTSSGAAAVLFNDDFTVALNSPTFQNLDSSTTVTFRIYGFDDLDVNGTINRLDNIVINGTIPEPSVAALGALAAFGLLRRRR
jgi:hypothetical protein